jgi:exonuclease SbcD
MPRFIHAADIHLDSPLQKLSTYQGAPVEEIRGASRRALTRLTDLAISEAVDFVLIAGDLYDGDWRDQQTGLFFVTQATKLVKQGIPLYIIRGNHDAANVMTQTLPLPKNPDGTDILLSDKQADSIRLEHLGISIHGRSFGQRAETENLAATYPAPDHGLFNIGMLHTSLQGLEGHDSYAPCSPIMLADKNYDYWALGHIHTRGDHTVFGGAPIVFSGNIQGRHTRETGPKGCYVVDTGPGHRSSEVTKTFFPLDVVRWETIAIDASGHESIESILDTARNSIEDLQASLTRQSLVVRIRVSGETSLHGELSQNRRKYEAYLQAISLDIADGSTWIESLRVRTQFPQHTVQWTDDGPLSCVIKVLDNVDTLAASNQNLLESLSTLSKKLPDAIPSPTLESLIEEARAALINRLK